MTIGLEDILLDDLTGLLPTLPGQILYDGTDFLGFADGSVKSLTSGGGLTPSEHQDLDQLVHVISESGVVEDTYDADGCFEAREIRTAASPGGVPIRRWDNFTFDADGCISGYRVQQYDNSGVVVQTLTVSRPGGVWTTALT
jgi:hypothetical protein